MSSYALRASRALRVSSDLTPSPGEKWVFWQCPRYPWTVLAVEQVGLVDDDANVVVLTGVTGTERRLRLDRFRQLYVPAHRIGEID